MRNFGRFAVFQFLVLIIVFVPAFANDYGNAKPFAFVHEFLQANYPDLLRHDLDMTISSKQVADTTWDRVASVDFLIVRPAVENPPINLNGPSVKPETHDTVLLRGNFWFTADGSIRQMSIIDLGPTNANRRQAFMKQFRAHPNWSDDEVYRAMKEAGARYGPGDKQQFIQSIPFDKLAKFLGRLKIQSVDFNGVDRYDRNTSRFSWFVRADSTLPDGSHGVYGMEFEPFDGKLVFAELTQ